MPNNNSTFLFSSDNSYFRELEQLSLEDKEKILNIERKRWHTKQDLYIVAGQIYSLDLHPIDSWTLFQWMQERDIPSRFIIRRASQFYKTIEAKGQTKDVIAVNSDCLHNELLDQTELFLRAKAVLVEWRTDSFVDHWLKHLPGCRYVFIQHGIIGTWICGTLLDVFNNEYNDLNVSSEFELSVVASNENIRKRCFIAGLPRFDLLTNQTTDGSDAEKVIFVMFTWRSTLNDGTEELEDSHYLKGLQALLSEENIIRFKRDHIRFVFSPHHVIAHILKDFNLNQVEVIKSQEKVAYWIKHADMLITDFSSVSFDFLFQEKPVIYWIPDIYDEHLNNQDKEKIKSALQQRQHFFNTVNSVEEVLNRISYYAKNLFILEEEYKTKARSFFTYRENFSQRIFDNVNTRINEERKNKEPIEIITTMPKVSIIIPAYNVEKYLSTCLESLIAQTYEDFEAIVIDDGSTDYTPQICEQYIFRDGRIKVVRQENAGVSVARNKGLELAQGEYITFIDADDWVEKDYLSTIVHTQPECDLLFFGNTHHHRDGSSHSYSPGERIAFEQLDREELLLTMIHNDCWFEFFGYTWNKRFKNSIIRKYNISFTPGLSLREDELFTDRYARFIKSVASTDKCIYNYRFSYGGLTYRFHPGSEVLLLAQGLSAATDGILHKRLYTIKKSKVFHYMFIATTNLHTKEALEVFDVLYLLYHQYYDILNKKDNMFLGHRARKRYHRIFAHTKWISRIYFLIKRKLMKKHYNAV